MPLLDPAGKTNLVDLFGDFAQKIGVICNLRSFSHARQVNGEAVEVGAQERNDLAPQLIARGHPVDKQDRIARTAAD
jgi:hypothetical protein